jgi:hypothetical protein
MRAIDVDPGGRFQSASEMQAALAQAGTARRRSRARFLRWTLASMLGGGFAAWGLLAWSRGDDPFEVEASVVRTGGNVSLLVQADQPIHLYVLAEDEKGRKYLLYPGWKGERKGPLEPGAVRRLPGEGGWEAGEMDGGCLLAMASVDPLGPLEDAVSEKPSPRGGKEGWNRLKPVTVRGLSRRIGEILRRSPDAVDAGEKALLADQAVEFGHQPGRWKAQGIWVGKAATGFKP